MKLFLRKWHWWKWNFMRWTKKHAFSVNLIGLFLKKERICGKFVPCFYFNLRTLYRTKTHSLSITRLNVEQVKCYCSKAIIQQTSHKNIFFQKKQHNHIKLPCNISALNSRFLENIVIPSKLDANRIIKFWKIHPPGLRKRQ